MTHGAYPYGGIDLARLFDSEQEVAATLGSRQPASFGVVVRNRNGKTRLVTARPANDDGGRRRPLRLLRAPVGVGSAGTPLHPFAGPFGSLRVTGMARGDGASVRSTYTFRRKQIVGDWTVRGLDAQRRAAPRCCSRATAASRPPCGRSCKSGEAVKLETERPAAGHPRLLDPERQDGLRRGSFGPRQGFGREDHPAQEAGLGAESGADAERPADAAGDAEAARGVLGEADDRAQVDEARAALR